jgi:hypothetical protein
MIPDRIFYPLAALLALLLIALAMVFPQGQGDRSPGPFGSMPVQQTPAAQAELRREAALDAKTKETQRAMEAAKANADAGAAAGHPTAAAAKP